MAVPSDMQHVPTIIEKHYVELVDRIARAERISRSRAVRDLVIEALNRRFSLSESFSEETNGATENPKSVIA
jgi:metal-responsive CopG/Arc/MetJ family transcriptional regulator